MAKQALGRGFGALMPENLDRSIIEEDKNRVQKLLIQDIKPNPSQPRREMDEKALGELTASVKRYGVLQPIIVIRAATGPGYQIVAGERRWRAAKAAKLQNIPAIIRSLEELEQIELALIENIQRVDLSPLEQALSVYKLQHQFNLGLEQIAEKLGKAPSTVSNISRLLQLPESARQALEQGKITEGHARAILALKDYPDRQTELLQSILNNGWSVRQAEQWVLDAKRSAVDQKTTAQMAQQQALADELSQRLKNRVKVRAKARGGELIIGFGSDDELKKIAERLLADD